MFDVQEFLLPFFIMWELNLIPVYLLLAVWGGKKCLYSPTKFILHTARGSDVLLLVVYDSNQPTLNLEILVNQLYPMEQCVKNGPNGSGGRAED